MTNFLDDHFVIIPVGFKRTCPECGRIFDLADENDADEFYNGHDCEEE